MKQDIWVNDGDALEPGDIVIEDTGKSVERHSWDGARIFRIIGPAKAPGLAYTHHAELIGVGHIMEMGTA